MNKSTLKITAQGLKSSHLWVFKTYFRANSYGWRGSKLAVKRTKEALREIKKVSQQDEILAAEGAIYLMSRFWPAFQQIDTSSGSLGSAVCSTMDELLPIITNAPAHLTLRQRWLDILWEILEADGVDYTSAIAEHWGELAGSTAEASRRADKFSSFVRLAWKHNRLIVHYDVAYLSALLYANRHDELLTAIVDDPSPSWWTRRFGALALAKRSPDDAISYAENTRHIINTSQISIDLFCEKILIDAGRTEDAYNRYAISANQASTYLNWFRKIKTKYGTIRKNSQILKDLVNSGVAEPGKWFATANKLKYFDVALSLIKDNPSDPKTLIRAAKDNYSERPSYALDVAIAALKWMVQGFGYEISSIDVHAALTVIQKSSKAINQYETAKHAVKKIIELESPKFYSDIISCSYPDWL